MAFLCKAQTSGGPNFFEPKLLGDQKSPGPKWDQGPFQFGVSKNEKRFEKSMISSIHLHHLEIYSVASYR